MIGLDADTLQTSAQTILIVDDNPTNIGVLADYFEERGFTILVARDGESGLEKAIYAQPDLILLDVMMPGMDGFETCRRLQAHQTTHHIPIIFMTALTDVDDKVKGFAVGAVDYVTKPLQQEEVLARVTTHLKIRSLTQRLQKANAALTQLNADKDKFFSILAHDLRGPFLPLLGSSELLARRVDMLSKPKIADMSMAIFESAQRVLDLLENLLQWGRLQIGHADYNPRHLLLPRVVRQNIELLRPGALTKEIILHHELERPLFLYADQNMLNFVLRNLLTNAIKFTPRGGRITISAQPYQQDFILIAIADTGVGMSANVIANLFHLDAHHSTPGTDNETGTGLGLILCQEMVQRNGGQIWIESSEGQGTTAYFTVPAVGETSPFAEETQKAS
ncbi:MAG: hybrid sensor histidine kinase/response regulator [Anaerolinea sp.]|nr:hybrid sensor histidine kinase/response regulator [Anaerolinea sp.]